MRVVLAWVLVSCLWVRGWAETASRVVDGPVTWEFGSEQSVGRFANGDYWVLGPVEIEDIQPRAHDGYHGWEVNPIYEGGQGFDRRAGGYDSNLMPALPYTARPGESLVKGVSRNTGSSGSRPSLEAASVLTVVGEISPDRGQTVFRPPYVGDEKPLYSASALRTDLLPSLAPVDRAPSLQWVWERYRRLQLDHKGGRTGRYLHPASHMPNYGGDIGRDNAEAALRLMLDDPIEERRPALICYVQYGIDLYHMALLGHVWPGGGGHRPGQKLPMSFAATMLDNEAMKELVREATFFHEDNGTRSREWGSDVALYGFGLDEERYWRVVVSGLDGSPSGNKSHADPYGYIDGGPEPGTNYQYCCTSQPWKGSALACHLMPAMKALWSSEDFFEYVDRYVEIGLWTQPDPCAPAVDDWSKYGVTFGPDGEGGCIKDTDPSDGIGRFPHLHGTKADEGHRGTAFQKAMWDTYRYRAPGQTTGGRHPGRSGSGGGNPGLRIAAHPRGVGIHYTLSRPSRLRIEVHDLLGKRVVGASREVSATGHGTAILPLSVPNGTYCVTVRAGTTSLSRIIGLSDRPQVHNRP